MKLVNRTKDTVLADSISIADKAFSRIKGLLGKKDFMPGEALMLNPCNSIHTFFMRFAIDVLFLDKDYRVVKTIPSLPPFRLSGIYFKAAFCVELPQGAIKSSLTGLGDKLILEY